VAVTYQPLRARTRLKAHRRLGVPGQHAGLAVLHEPVWARNRLIDHRCLGLVAVHAAEAGATAASACPCDAPRRRWTINPAGSPTVERWASDDLVQPADGGALAGVPERLELVVPGLAEQLVDLDEERGVAERGLDHGGLEPVLGDHDVAVQPGHGVEDAEVGRVGVPLTLAG